MLQYMNKSCNRKRINLIYRLDNGASRCLLYVVDDGHLLTVTEALINTLQSDYAIKTYIAIVYKSGVLYDKGLA